MPRFSPLASLCCLGMALCCRRRPQLQELQHQNAALREELAGVDAQLLAELAGLKEEHGLLLATCRRWEVLARGLCARHGEPLPAGL